MIGIAEETNTALPVETTGGLQQQALTTANLGVVSDLWMGHVTATSLRVSATVAGSPTAVRLVASEFSGFLQGWVGDTDAPGDYDIVKLDIDTLQPDTKYFIALEVDGVVDTATVGVMTTPANPEGEPFSFQFGTASCSRFHDRVVYNHIRNNNPNMQLFMHSGDLHYEDINVNNEDLYQEAFSDTLGAQNVGAWFRSMPILYMWDDHDYGANDSGSDSPSRPAAMAAFRRRVPTPDLAAPGTTVDDAVYYTFRVGRLRFIVTDLRSQRSVQSSVPEGPNRTMMGAQQKAWFKSVLEDPANENDVFCWVNSVPWIGTPSGSSDFWAGYSTERAELATFFRDANVVHRLFMVSGDMHALTHDDGTNSDYADGGGAPLWVFQCAPIANTTSVKGGPYSAPVIQQQSLYGVFDVEDTGGNTITINFSGRYVSQSNNTETEVQTASVDFFPSATKMVDAEPATLSAQAAQASGEGARVIAGVDPELEAQPAQASGAGVRTITGADLELGAQPAGVTGVVSAGRVVYGQSALQSGSAAVEAEVNPPVYAVGSLSADASVVQASVVLGITVAAAIGAQGAAVASEVARAVNGTGAAHAQSARTATFMWVPQSPVVAPWVKQ